MQGLVLGPDPAGGDESPGSRQTGLGRRRKSIIGLGRYKAGLADPVPAQVQLVAPCRQSRRNPRTCRCAAASILSQGGEAGNRAQADSQARCQALRRGRRHAQPGERARAAPESDGNRVPQEIDRPGPEPHRSFHTGQPRCWCQRAQTSRNADLRCLRRPTRGARPSPAPGSENRSCRFPARLAGNSGHEAQCLAGIAGQRHRRKAGEKAAAIAPGQQALIADHHDALVAFAAHQPAYALLQRKHRLGQRYLVERVAAARPEGLLTGPVNGVSGRLERQPVNDHEYQVPAAHVHALPETSCTQEDAVLAAPEFLQQQAARPARALGHEPVFPYGIPAQ